MAKSKILKDLANDTVSLKNALSRLMIIAADIGNEKLYNWAKVELGGYKKGDIIPDFRVTYFANIIYTGINGRLQVKNQPLPMGVISEKNLENVSLIRITDSIADIEKIVSQNEKTVIDLTYLAGEVYKNSGIQCISIYNLISLNLYMNILSEIRTKLLELFIILDKEFGCLDELDIDIKAKDKSDILKIQKDLSEILYSDNELQIID